MPDHFTVLQQPRRPWLDVAVLKERFRVLTGVHHPDVAGAAAGGAFAAMNAAFATLRDPVLRLRHLLELEFPEQAGNSQAIPPDLADRFMKIAALLRRLEAVRQKRVASSSALATALLADDT